VQAAKAFMKIGQQTDAAAILENALAVQWDARLLRAYRQCAAPEGSGILMKQIEHCEHWLRERPNDAEIAIALGVLCLRQKLWGKAQRHLEQSLTGSDIAIRQEAHLRLAQMHEALSQPEAAAEHYRQCAMTIQLASKT
jgi:HemY protein